MYPIFAILHSFVRAPKAKRTILKFLSENNFDDPRRKIAFVLRFPQYLAPGYKRLKTNIPILNILINFNNEWSSIDESKPMKVYFDIIFLSNIHIRTISMSYYSNHLFGYFHEVTYIKRRKKELSKRKIYNVWTFKNCIIYNIWPFK